MRGEIKKSKKSYIPDATIFLFAALGICLLTACALNHIRVFWDDLQDIKMITYVLINMLIVRILFRALSRTGVVVKYLITIVAFAVLTVGIFFYNNYLHYMDWVSLFGYDTGITYQHFAISDIKYSLGFGQFRYILFFVLGPILYMLFERGILRKILGVIFNFLVNITNKIGLGDLTGINALEVVEDEEKQQLIEILQNNMEMGVFKSDENDFVQYTVEVKK